MRKIFNNFFLLAMIIIIPGLSWLFLKGGVDYRLESLGGLQTVDTIIAHDYLDTTVIKLKNRVTLISFDSHNEIISNLYDQFKDAPGFQIISTDKPQNNIDNSPNFFVLDSIQAVRLRSKASLTGNYALVDGDFNIRSVYKDTSESKLMVRHIATVLPYVEKKKRKK